MVKYIKIHSITKVLLVAAVLVGIFAYSPSVFADQCGKGEDAVRVGVDFGCRGEEFPRPALNPIIDMAFAVFRFLSVGVGLVIIGSIMFAGIQYSTSRGNPQATQAAIKRITGAISALVLYMFIFALANFLIPGGMFL